MPTREDLRSMQAAPLSVKVLMTKERIRHWANEYGEGNVYVSFSGGKDSTVLLDIAKQMIPTIKATFFNTGLEYPEVRTFALSHENVEEIRPLWGKAGKSHGKDADAVITFKDTLTYYGYPLLGKQMANAIEGARTAPGKSRWKRMHGMYRRVDGKKSIYDYSHYLPILELPVMISDNCCHVNKKTPAYIYERRTGSKPMTAMMAEESVQRTQAWLKTGCNAFAADLPVSSPMAFWTEQDVLRYIVEHDIKIASVYGNIVWEDADGLPYDAKVFPAPEGCKLHCTGCTRTGCVFCAFGLHLEKGETRFQRLRRTHPKLYDFCMSGGGWSENPKYDPSKVGTEYWNPKEIWTPTNGGLGMAKVFDMVNELFGKNFMRYE